MKYLPTDSLQPYKRNARTHTKQQLRQIADSIRFFGFTNPILVGNDGKIIAGHGRWEAAKLLAMETVPVLFLDDLTEDQIRAYVIADNKLAEKAGWDQQILAIELQHLITINDFDITLTGFEVAEAEFIIGESLRAEVEPEVITDPASDHLAVSVIGDHWLLGRHHIFCGDSLKEDSYLTLLSQNKAAAIFCDSPYNVKIDGHATGNGKIKHREFAMASGEMTDEEFMNFLLTFISLLVKYSAPQSVHYVCMDWLHIEALLAAGRRHYGRLLNLCVWVKDNGGMGSFYRSQHELVAVFGKDKKGHRNNVQLGKFGRNRTNVWEYPGVRTSSNLQGESNLLSLHPTVKPTKMIADAILDCTKPGDIVLDVFLGSGSSLIAAEQVGRICYGIEIDPLYIDTTIRRWEKHTGNQAVHIPTNKTFAEIAKEKAM